MAESEVRVARPAIYIRWSTEDQGEGTTLDVQMDACRAFILSQGWAFSQELLFIDDGVSGATLERPALTTLRARVQAGEVDCVVVYKLDRLSRTVLDMLKLVLEEWDGKCSIKSAREPIDTLTPSGKMFFYQLMSFAEWERSVIRDRTFAGKLRRATEGKSPGLTLPYGYRKAADGRIEQDPDAAVIIRRIFRLYLSGLGCRAISQALNQEGLPTAKGGPWGQPSVGDILANPAYVGTLVYGRTKARKDGKRVERAPLVVKEGFYPPIVTRAEFEAVQKLRQERPGVGRRQGSGRTLGSKSLLTGLLRCRCGFAYTGRSLASRGHRYSYYICAAVQKTGAGRCSSGNIRQSDLDGLVVAQLLAMYSGEQAKDRVLAYLTGDLTRRQGELQIAREAAEKDLRKLEESERRLKGWLLEGSLSLDEYRGLQAELNGKLGQAKTRVDSAVQAESSARATLEAYAHNTRLLARISEWDKLTLAEQKQLLRQFVSAVTVYRDRVSHELACDITWKWAAPGAGRAFPPTPVT